MGLISARVKATHELFLVGADLGTDDNPTWRDPVKPLQGDRWYAGNLLTGEVGQTHYVEYDQADWVRFKGSDLEETSSDLRLLNVRVSK
jgi:hypothetical protein